MFSIPQYLDFDYNDRTGETCRFLLEMLHRKSDFLYLHAIQVANYAIAVAAKLGLSAKEISLIRTAALMHDIGLLSVPNNILNKYPYLSVREWRSTSVTASPAAACWKTWRNSAASST